MIKTPNLWLCNLSCCVKLELSGKKFAPKVPYENKENQKKPT